MSIDWESFHAAVWRSARQTLRPIVEIDSVPLDSLLGVERQKQEVCTNTEQFLAGEPANNVLLWGARGTGKSSLIKALLPAYAAKGLRLIEVYKTDLHDLPEIVDGIRDLPQKFILYCDDFSFEANDHSYVALKTLLEGSIEKAPQNVLLYATSNRRHLVPESMADNQNSHVVGDEVHYADAIEEKISLADRFGLWLSFYQPDWQQFLRIVDYYFRDLDCDREQLHEAARHFARDRAAHSGRTARQFYNYYRPRL